MRNSFYKIMAAALACGICILPVHAQTRYTWNGGTGSWQTPSNWTPAGVPAAADTAVINGGTAANDNPVTVAGFIQNGGTLDGAGELTITTLFNWSAGAHGGTGTTTVASGATGSIFGGFGKTLSRTIINEGSFVLEGTGPVAFSTAAALINNGSFDFQANVTLGGGGVGSITNNGTFTRSSGTGAATIATSFINNGTVQVQSGVLASTLATGGDGAFVIQAGQTFRLSAGTHTLGGNAISGGGTFELSSGALNFSGVPVTVASGATFLHAGGSVGGDGNLTVNGNFVWESGTHGGAGTTTIASGGAGSMAGGFGKTLSRPLLNEGSFILGGSATVTFSTGAALTNNGNFDFQANVTLGSGGVGSVANNGTFTRSSGTGAATIATSFINNGTVQVQSGALQSTLATSGSGSFVIDAGRTFRLNGGTHTLGGNAISGGGTFELSSGALNFSGNPVTVAAGATFLHLGGSVGGDGNLTVNGNFVWESGTHGGAGTTTVASGAAGSIFGGFGKTLSRTIINEGSFVLEGTGPVAFSTAAALVNNGSFDFQANVTLGSGGVGSVANNGTFTRSSGTGAATIATSFINNGTVQVQSGALQSTLATGGNGAFVIEAGQTFRLSGGTHTLGGNAISGGGTFELTSGALNFSGNPVTVASGATFLHLGGSVGGDGNLTVNGNFVWESGTHGGGGTTTIASGAAGSMAGGFGKTLSRTLLNEGSFVLGGTAPISFSSGAALVNNGSFDFQANVTLGSGGAGSIANNGTFIRSSGTATAAIATSFINNGTVQVQSGVLASTLATSGGGAFVIQAGQTFRLSGGTHTLGGNAISGGGTFELSSGALNFSGNPVTVAAGATFLHLGGSVGGDGNLTVNGNFVWESGTHGGTGTTTIASGATGSMAGGFGKALSRTLLNEGSFVLGGTAPISFSSGAALVNNGSFDFQANVTLGSGGVGSVANNGTFTRSSGSGTATVATRFTNNGTLSILSGALSCSDSLINAAAGLIGGVGTLTPPTGNRFINRGTVAPGVSPGVLRVSGNYPQTASAALDIEIGGYAAGSERDSLSVTAQAQLDGALKVQFIDNFLPQAGDVFAVMGYASRSGQFAQIHLSHNVQAQAQYLANRLQLLITQVGGNQPPTAPALLLPANGDSLSPLPPVTFLWSASTDPENDPLSYALRVFGPGLDSTLAGLSDTTAQFHGAAHFQPGNTYQWQVTASDGSLAAPSEIRAFYVRSPALAGVYTVGAGGDYPTIKTATRDLRTYGMSGPVTLRILPGVYQEPVLLTPIAGASPERPVVIESSTGNRADVTWTVDQFDSACVLINGARHVTLRNLTFTRTATHGPLVEFSILPDPNNPPNRHVRIEGNEFVGVYANPASSLFLGLITARLVNDLDSVAVIGNTFRAGQRAISMQGSNQAGGGRGIRVENNRIEDPVQYGIYLESLEDPLVSGNEVLMESPMSGVQFRYGIVLFTCREGLQVLGNRVSVTLATTVSNSILFGINLISCEGGGSRGLIANNFVRLNFQSSTSPLYSGYGVYVLWSRKQDVFYNSVQVSGALAAAESRALYFSSTSSTGAGEHRVKNNIAVNLAGGHALWTGWTGAGTFPPVSESDYNDLYGAGTPLIHWNNVDYPDLASYQAATGQDLHSLSVRPRFLSPSDLHLNDPALNNAGTPLAEVLFDIDGEPRDPNTPDVGADEFTPLGLSGVFTIGSGGDFPSISAATRTLRDSLVSGPVTLRILPGVYQESVLLTPIAGASPERPVVIESSTGNRADVTWTVDQFDSACVLINGARYLTLRNLTFTRTATHGPLVEFSILPDPTNPPNRHVRIEGNEFVGVYANPASSLFLGLITARLVNDLDSVAVIGNTFRAGQRAISMQGSNQAGGGRGIRVENNRIEDPVQYGIYLESLEDPLVSGNEVLMESPMSGVQFRYGIVLFTCREGLQVLGNRVSVTMAATVANSILFGINLISCEGGGSRGLIANNFVRLNFQSSTSPLYSGYGVYVLWSRKQDVFYNSVQVSGALAAAQSRALYFSSTSSTGAGEHRVKNNIAVNLAGGHALWTGWTGAGTFPPVSESDYNDLYGAGTPLIHWNNVDYPNLAGYQAATGQDLHSFSADPLFVSASDLHLSPGSPADGQGTPLAEVLRDIDGQLRSLTAPDVGADEYTQKRRVVVKRTQINLGISGPATVGDTLRVRSDQPGLLPGYVVGEAIVLLDTLFHSSIEDLEIRLLHNGVHDTLVYQLANGAVGFLGTVLSDSAQFSLAQGAPPFTGAFRPYRPLSVFRGSDPEGDWILQIYDRSTGNFGTLNAWGLELVFEFPTGVAGEPPAAGIPANFELAQNYPNPFNPGTTIRFAVPGPAVVQLDIFDMLGRRVAGAYGDTPLPAGWHEYVWDGRTDAGQPAASGVYFYRLRVSSKESVTAASEKGGDQFVQTRKMILLR